MILTDREIQLALATRQIVITPPPTDDAAFSSTSVDLTLDEPGETWQSLGAGQPIRPGARGYNYHQTRARKTKFSFNRHTLAPGDFVLGYTVETVELPIQSRLAARVEGKSGLARLGMVVHLTAPIIHAGFKGQIQLEICNVGPNHIELDVGMAICQVIFEITFGTPIKGYSGLFSGQTAGA